MNSLQDNLPTIPIFSFLGRDEITAVQSLFVESTHQKGEYICREGDEGDTFHIILDGELEVSVGHDDSTRVLSILKKGDFFGEMALLDGAPRSADITALGEVTVMVIARAAFSKLLRSEPQIAQVLLRTLAGRLRAAQKQF